MRTLPSLALPLFAAFPLACRATAPRDLPAQADSLDSLDAREATDEGDAAAGPDSRSIDLVSLLAEYANWKGVSVTFDEATGARLGEFELVPVGDGIGVLQVRAAQPTPAFETWALKSADADRLADELGAVFGAVEAVHPEQASVRLLGDPRTNSLLVMAPPEYLPALRALVERLDRDETAGG